MYDFGWGHQQFQSNKRNPEVTHVTRSWIADSVLVGLFFMTCSGQSLQQFGLTTCTASNKTWNTEPQGMPS